MNSGPVHLPRVLKQALHHLESGRPDRCLQLCNEMLAESPGLIQALYLRGCAAYRTGDAGAAVADLGIVCDNHPEHLHAAWYYGRSLQLAGRFEDALEPLRVAAGEKGLEMRARYELAACLARLRRRREAIEEYRHVLRLQPHNGQVAANLAFLLERENRLEEAELWTARALRLAPANETAEMTRAVLDRRSGNVPRAARRFRRLTGKLANPVNRSIAWNHLGQCLEKLGEWDEAFDAFSESNRILQAHHPGARVDPRGPHGMQTLGRIRSWLRTEPVKGWRDPAGAGAGGIAFLVGFPRSGTTLLDRMLSAHPDIEVLEEKSLFSALHRDWSEPGELEALAEVNASQIEDARHIYRRELARCRRRPQRPLVIDKLPLNLVYLFLVRRLFPAAPVVFVQRHPLDACISCFFQSFELEASMAYFLEIGNTARFYDAVMQVAILSMDQVSNPLQRVRYEDLVAEPSGQLEPLLRFLGLAWDDSVLDYRERAGAEASNTPSYQQIMQPLHSRSVGRWRHYRKQIGAALPLLLPWVDRFGYGNADSPGTENSDETSRP